MIAWPPYLYDSIIFFNDTATTEIYTLSLHDALPIYGRGPMVSIEAEDDLGSAIRGAAAASGTTTTIAAIQAGTADRADSVSRRRRVSSTSSSRVASCAGRAMATLASTVARAARRSRAISSRCVA